MPGPFSVRIRGLGPVYVATERNSGEPAHLSRAWIIELAPPYRKGHGWRLRVGRRALQVGVCTKHPEVTEERLVEHLDWHWMPYSPQEVRDAIDALDPLGQGDDDEGVGDEQVWAEEPLGVRGDRVVGGSDLS